MPINGARWRKIIRHTWSEYLADQVSIVASGVAFQVALAIFPAIALLVWIGTHAVGATEAQTLIETLSGVVPDSSRQIIEQAMRSSMRNNPVDENGRYAFLGAIAPAVGMILMTYSANNGMRSLFNALNIIYDMEERRGFLHFTAITLLFTFGTLVAILGITAAVVAAPTILAILGMSGSNLVAFRLLRWPVLFVTVATGLALLYRFAPNRDRERWRVVTFGSALASLLIVALTALFSWFTNRFASLALTYGSLSTAIASMLWLWALFWIVLVCAELDSCIDEDGAPCNGERSARPRDRDDDRAT